MVKEIRELEDEIREVEVKKLDLSESSWEERDFQEDSEQAVESSEEEKDKFDIGDTMLARGEKRDSWRSETLEEKTWEDELEDYGEEELEEETGFSYEDIASNSDDLYGVGGANDLYGVGGPGDFYGVASQASSDMYNTGRSQPGGMDAYSIRTGVAGTYAVGSKSTVESSYAVGGKKGKKKDQGVYAVGVGEKKKDGRKGKSGLVDSLSNKRKRKGVSMY